jgi:hypothetical protein
LLLSFYVGDLIFLQGNWQPDWKVDEGVGGGGDTNSAHQGQVVAQLPPARL